MGVFSQMLWDLKSGDLYVEGSDQYADHRTQLISWEDYAQQVEAYGVLVELTADESSLYSTCATGCMPESCKQTPNSPRTSISILTKGNWSCVR